MGIDLKQAKSMNKELKISVLTLTKTLDSDTADEKSFDPGAYSSGTSPGPGEQIFERRIASLDRN